MRYRTISVIAAVAIGVGISASAHAAAVVVTAVGTSTSTNQNWLTNGFAKLNGVTSGVNWLVSGQQEGVDWTRIDGANQGVIGGATVEWPTAGTFSQLSYSGSPGILGIGPQMQAHLAGSPLRIAEVAPTTGTYTLNGVSLTSAAVGQVLVWNAATVTQGDTLTFTHDGNISAGPIGFSQAVPEPASLAALALAAVPGLSRRRRHRA